MKKFGSKIIFGKNSRWSLLFVVAALIFAGLACGGGSKGNFKPVPAAFYGDWTSSEGTTLNISTDSTVIYRSGATKIDNGAAELDESAKILKLSLLGVSLKEFKVDQMPNGGTMKLDGVVFRNAAVVDNGDKDPGDKGSTDDPDMPSESEISDMVRDTILAYKEGVEGEDFTEFRRGVSKTFQEQFSAEQMKKAFKPHIDEKKRFVPVLNAVSDSTLNYSWVPTITTADTGKGPVKLLNANGFYNASEKAKFELQYMLEDGEWKLLKIKVLIGG